MKFNIDITLYIHASDNTGAIHVIVVELLRDEKAVVKTVRNADWTSFFEKFAPCEVKGVIHEHHKGDGPKIGHKVTEDNRHYPFNSFVTSCSLL